MYKYLIAVWAVLTLAACARPAYKTERNLEKTQMTGGYTQQRPLDAEELELFEKVTEKLLGVTYTPESVATQVVAGTNYRFLCTATTVTREPQTYKAEITVFCPLPGRGEPKITAIKRL